jgi:hypothetical protein
MAGTILLETLPVASQVLPLIELLTGYLCLLRNCPARPSTLEISYLEAFIGLVDSVVGV